MHCPSCRCDYPSWLPSCPPCGSPLEHSAPIDVAQIPRVDYTELVSRVAEAAGSLSIGLLTTAVGTERDWRFAYRGFGHAWADRMSGQHDDLVVELRTTEVGRHHKSVLLYYVGYGFAWTKQLEGVIAGNPVHLVASKVEMEKKTRFPYLGYGFSWTQEMTGDCGDQLTLELVTSEVARTQGVRFPLRGYGFAWARRAVLTIRSA